MYVCTGVIVEALLLNAAACCTSPPTPLLLLLLLLPFQPKYYPQSGPCRSGSVLLVRRYRAGVEGGWRLHNNKLVEKQRLAHETGGRQTGSWHLMQWHWLREEGEGLCKVPQHWLREEWEGLCKVPWHWLREEGEGLCKMPRHWLTLQSLATASGWKGVFRAERYCKRNTNTCMVIHPHTNTTPVHMHIYVVTYIHTCIQKIRNTDSYRLAHIHTYIHTHTHTHTRIRTHIHTHTSIQANTRTPSLYLKDISKEGHFWLGEHVKVMHHGPSLEQQGGVGGRGREEKKM